MRVFPWLAPVLAAAASVTAAQEVPHRVVYEGERHELVSGSRETEFLALEVYRYPDGTERYVLEMVAFHGMMNYPFELDSWKHRPGRI